MPDHRFGAAITLDGALAGLFLDGAHPGEAGEYAYMPVRSIGHHDMAAAVRSGRTPCCSWTAGHRSASFEVRAIPRYGVLLIAAVVVSEDGASRNGPAPPGDP